VTLSELDEIVLVDDIVTRGATLLGAANILAICFSSLVCAQQLWVKLYSVFFGV